MIYIPFTGKKRSQVLLQRSNNTESPTQKTGFQKKRDWLKKCVANLSEILSRKIKISVLTVFIACLDFDNLSAIFWKNGDEWNWKHFFSLSYDAIIYDKLCMNIVVYNTYINDLCSDY